MNLIESVYSQFSKSMTNPAMRVSYIRYPINCVDWEELSSKFEPQTVHFCYLGEKESARDSILFWVESEDGK